MRALCGAIIAAGAFIGLGLTAIGIGTRYERDWGRSEGGEPYLIHLSQMDRPLTFVLVFLTCGAVIGLGITILGLAYHHLRREREHTLERDRITVHPEPTKHGRSKNTGAT